MTAGFVFGLDWRKGPREISYRQVVPVVGPEVSTARDPITAEDIALTRALAPRLGAVLDLLVNGSATTINGVACEQLLWGGLPGDLYAEVADLIRKRDGGTETAHQPGRRRSRAGVMTLPTRDA